MIDLDEMADGMTLALAPITRLAAAALQLDEAARKDGIGLAGLATTVRSAHGPGLATVLALRQLALCVQAFRDADQPAPTSKPNHQEETK